MQQITDDQKAMLELERHWWQYTGTKEQVVRDRFGVSMTRYNQSLRQLVKTPAAQAYDPLVCKRIERIIARRRGRSVLSS